MSYHVIMPYYVIVWHIVLAHISSCQLTPCHAIIWYTMLNGMTWYPVGLCYIMLLMYCTTAVPASRWSKWELSPMPEELLSQPLLPKDQLAEGSARMQEVSGSNPRLGGLGVSSLQASRGISTLQSRASGLQSTTQGNSIGTTKRPLRVKRHQNKSLHPVSNTIFNLSGPGP